MDLIKKKMMERISNVRDTVEDLKSAFRVFDKDTSKEFIPSSELRHVLYNLEGLSKEEADDCLHYFDADGNGKINFEG